MSLRDVVRYAGGAIVHHRLRSGLTMLGILIGIASVILLTSVGEGTRLYILSEFTQFGTNLLSVNPGKIQTTGIPGALGGTIHPLTLDDSDALLRVPGVEKVVPVVMGTARVEAGQKGRNVAIYGVTSDVPAVWKFQVRQGRFLPPGEAHRGAPLAVLGPTLKREIFGERNALGDHVRIGGERFLVIGVMAPKGQLLGYDLDDAAYIPVSLATDLFNRRDLMEIDVLFTSTGSSAAIAGGVRRVLLDRHDGEEDFTITTQTEMLGTLDRILRIVSLSVGGIGAISLLVGSIGILTMMWISVRERTAEIGIAKALGATRGQIVALYLAEAAILSTTGGALGVVAGMGLARMLRFAIPALPVHTPPAFVALAVGVSLLVGLASGILPARRAASLDPIEALAAE